MRMAPPGAERAGTQDAAPASRWPRGLPRLGTRTCRPTPSSGRRSAARPPRARPRRSRWVPLSIGDGAGHLRPGNDREAAEQQEQECAEQPMHVGRRGGSGCTVRWRRVRSVQSTSLTLSSGGERRRADAPRRTRPRRNAVLSRGQARVPHLWARALRGARSRLWHGKSPGEGRGGSSNA